MHSRVFRSSFWVLCCLLLIGSGCGLDDASTPPSQSQSNSSLQGEFGNKPTQAKPTQATQGSDKQAQSGSTSSGELDNRPTQDSQEPKTPEQSKQEEPKQEEPKQTPEDNPPKTCTNSCRPIIHARFACDGSSVVVDSCKDLSNVVLQFTDGTTRKFEGLSGKQQSFGVEGKTLQGVWVKSGCNKSGDGPGYGEYFAKPEEDPSCGGGSDDPTPAPGGGFR